MFATELIIAVTNMRLDLACEIRTIAVKSKSDKFVNYIEVVLRQPSPNTNIVKAHTVLGGSLDPIELEMIEDLFSVYSDLVGFNF
jgi:hypothetical protein